MASSPLCGGNKKFLLGVVAILILQQIIATDEIGYRKSRLAKPGCQDKCGSISVPYPFGIGHGCFLNKDFEVICDEGQENVAILNTSYGTPLLDISLSLGEARSRSPIAWYCNYTNGTVVTNTIKDTDGTESYWLDYRVGPAFTISKAKNKFTAIGCATDALIDVAERDEYTNECESFCSQKHKHRLDKGAECTGMGCCQTSIPGNLQASYSLGFFLHNNANAGVRNFSPCSYGFLVEDDWFKFDPSYVNSSYFQEHYGDKVPLVLDLVIGNVTCAEAKNQSSYACIDKNSICIEAPNGPGYRCNCSQGYEGNPYLDGSCQDINECDSPSLYPCHGKCKNTIGSYTCMCPPGTQSKDPKNAQCIPDYKMIIGLSFSSVFIIVCAFIVITSYEKKKLTKEKERFFKQNGGHILYQQILSKQVDTVTIFPVEELKKATDNFDKSRVLGTGGHGTVYKGFLRNNRVVAVKRSKIIDVAQTDEFVQEIIILSQINHRNVVRLLGCCLEVEVPMLVYEFIPNGTLFHLIHDYRDTPLSLETRLRIAQDSAEALEYLHLCTNHSIVHGDVKSMNILLDENFMAKVTDFGASRILPKDAVQLMTLVQGTLGYLDPEYLQERKLTEKSDVYSFGVVLLELITRKTAIYFDGPGEGKSLASTFVQAMKENKVESMIDSSIMGMGLEELFQEVVELASMCLSLKGDDRPSMAQVADKLKAVRSTWKGVLLFKHEETQRLIQRLAMDPVRDLSLSPSMSYTAQMLGLEIQIPEQHTSTTTTNTE